MSRLIVKNIGKTTTEKQLRDLFGSKGEVTDVRIPKTNSGKSRQFAFIGYRNEEQCVAAQKYFDCTYINTSKMTVEIAKSINDPTLNSAKSRHTQKKIQKMEAERKKHEVANLRSAEKNAKGKAKEDINPPDRSKLEFLEVMKARSKADVWGNDDISTSNKLGHVQPSADKSEDESDDDSDYDQNIALSARSISTTRGTGSGSEGDSDKEKMDEKKVVSDMDYLRGKMTSNISEISDSEAEENGDSDSAMSESEGPANKKARIAKSISGKSKTKPDKEDSSDVDSVAIEGEAEESASGRGGDEPEEFEEGRLFVRNLPFGCSEEELMGLFASYGPVSQVHLPLDENKRTKGIGFVQFMFPEHASTALQNLDGSSFQGRLLHVLQAKTSHPSEENTGSGVSGNSHLSAFQKKKEEERRKMAGKREGWNASYVRSDAVVDSLSDRYGLSGGDILDAAGVGGGELAVRLAIGETHVLQDNREYFLSHGVDIDILESALQHKKKDATKNKQKDSAKDVKRSGTTILIKNLPHDLNAEELEDMFARFGSLSSFLIPKSKTVALVDFIEPTEARKAFTTLAYRRYHHVPLYLEWAPMHTIDKSKATAASSTPSGENGKKNGSNKSGLASSDADSGEYSTLYIKNLNFETSEDDLMKHMTGRLGINSSNIRTVSIPKKQKNGHILSMGFGFVEFKSSSGAAEMMMRINASVLDGHALEAKPSDKRLSVATKATAMAANDPNATNKLVVRNVAFQATREELMSLFAVFGAVKRIRIPRKVGGVHRGFAFVDFSSKQEAAAAMSALSSTHLYGRHLVIEYAKEGEDDMEKLRDQAKQHAKAITSAAVAAGRKRKVSDVLSGGDGFRGGGGGEEDISMLYEE